MTWKGGSNITTTQAVPGTWTQLDATRNQATNIGAQVWYKNATVADTTGGSYTWNFAPNAIATGGIAAYTGIDKSATPAVAQLITAPTNDATVYYPTITPAANGAQVISVVAWNRARTEPTSRRPSRERRHHRTDRWETVNSGAITSGSPTSQNVAAAVNERSNTAGGREEQRPRRPDCTEADICTYEQLRAQLGIAAGSAYYSGAGRRSGTGAPARCTQGQVAASARHPNTVSDAGSGPASSIFAALGVAARTGPSPTAPLPRRRRPHVSTSMPVDRRHGTPTDLITGTDNAAFRRRDALTLTNDVTGPTFRRRQ